MFCIWIHGFNFVYKYMYCVYVPVYIFPFAARASLLSPKYMFVSKYWNLWQTFIFNFINGTCSFKLQSCFFHHHDVTVNTMIHILPMNMFRNMFIVKKILSIDNHNHFKKSWKRWKISNKFLLLSKEHLDISLVMDLLYCLLPQVFYVQGGAYICRSLATLLHLTLSCGRFSSWYHFYNLSPSSLLEHSLWPSPYLFFTCGFHWSA